MIRRPTRVGRYLAAPLVVAALVAALPRQAWSNAAPPFRMGQLAVEPEGLTTVVIAGEVLSIDLRPVESGNPARVRATYRLRCDSGVTELPLLFITGVESVQWPKVLFNGERIEFATRQVDPRLQPESWRTPSSTPGIVGTPGVEGGDPLWFPGSRANCQLEFQLPLTAGEHEMSVEYSVRPAAHWTSKAPTVFWQLAYILAPARAWGGFEQLRIEVLVPSGWQVATNPPLDRDGDRLIGQFDRLPADSLALTARAPVGSRYYWLRGLGRFAMGFTLLGIPAGLFFFAGWLGASQGQTGWAVVRLLIGSTIWAAAWVGSVVLLTAAPYLSIAEPQRPGSVGYAGIFIVAGTVFVLILIFALGLPVQVLIMQLVRYRVRQATKAVAPRTG